MKNINKKMSATLYELDESVLLSSVLSGGVIGGIVALSDKTLDRAVYAVPIGMLLLFVAAMGGLFRNLVFLFGAPELRREAQGICPELQMPESEAVVSDSGGVAESKSE